MNLTFNGVTCWHFKVNYFYPTSLLVLSYLQNWIIVLPNPSLKCNIYMHLSSCCKLSFSCELPSLGWLFKNIERFYPYWLSCSFVHRMHFLALLFSTTDFRFSAQGVLNINVLVRHSASYYPSPGDAVVDNLTATIRTEADAMTRQHTIFGHVHGRES